MNLRFVVYEHHSSRLHFDFRLEMAGVLRSWAIPKGPSMNPSEKRLAIQVEDHPLDYIDFEGTIPDGEYGAGQVVIWDSGKYELFEQRKDMIGFSLKGRKLRGGFSLIQLKGRGKGNAWLLIKKKDEYARPDWKLDLSLTPQEKPRPKKRTPPSQTS
jgi:bifunctional non-homologous end joining protein LigD